MQAVIQAEFSDQDKKRVVAILNELATTYDSYQLLMLCLSQAAVIGDRMLAAGVKTPEDLENLFFNAWQEACESGGAGAVEIVGAPSKPLVSH